MKIFVASIDTWHFTISYGLTVAEKTKLVIDQLDKIHADANTELGEDAVVLVVMKEYALTPKAITANDKALSLAALQEAMKKYKRMILIPGSYATYNDFKNNELREIKTQKLLANYRSLSQSKLVNDHEFDAEEAQVLQRSKSGELAHSIFMQNCAYILTADSKYKHKKCAPFFETDKLKDNRKSGIYYIGADHPVKRVVINGTCIKLALLICREHNSIESSVLTAKDFNPLLQVIVSDSISTQKEKLFGALNVHIDHVDGLNVFRNSSHHQAKQISKVKAYTYNINNNHEPRRRILVSYVTNNFGLTKPEKDVSHFLYKIFGHKRARKEVSEPNLNDNHQLKKPAL